MMSAYKRLRRELRAFNMAPRTNYHATPMESNLLLWEATIEGARDTPYYSGTFKLLMKFPESYPFRAPRVAFVTRIYHCNIDLDGYICWDELSNNWTSVMTICKILNGICDLMQKPNVTEPYDETVAALYINDRERYMKTAVAWTLRYACPPAASLPAILDKSEEAKETEKSSTKI